MKKILLHIFIFLVPVRLLGQMLPLTDQYVHNMLDINPAYAGSQNALSATLQYRLQWVGFKDAPRDQILSVHAPLDKDRIGLGLTVECNSIGIFHETTIMGNYAYRLEINKGILALGLAFGLDQIKNDWNALKANDIDDVLLVNNPVSATLPTFSLGAYYTSSSFFAGFSLPRFLGHKLDESTGKYKISNNFDNYNYLVTGGYAFKMPANFILFPIILIKYHPHEKIQADCLARVIYADRVAVGFGYRSQSTLIGMLECHINDQLKIGYSYDFDSGSLGRYKAGSHEIVLNYIFNYTHKVMGPRQF
jgi:type IX secretion system PorP/SprF family membrane protein